MKIYLMLTDYEYTFLRSYILGISDLSIQKMLSLEIEQFQKIKSNLFLKHEVQNTYSAVRKALECGLLSGISYTEEDIKTKTLEFIKKRITSFQENSIKNENAIWEWYDLLLEYNNELNKIQQQK